MLRLPLFAFTVLLGASAFAQPGGGSGDNRRGPPPESLQACEGLSENDSCSFESKRGDEVEGICRLSPEGQPPLACAPENRAPENPPPRG